MKSVLLTVFLICFSCTQASAETIRELLARPDAETLVGVLGETIGWASSYSDHYNNAPIYCPPGKLSVTKDQYVTILSVYLTKEEPQSLDESATLAAPYLISALVYTFPCSKSEAN